MSILDFRPITPQQRLELIGEPRNSLEAWDVLLPPAQAAELDRRLATLDDDIAHAQDAFAVYDELTVRYR